MFEQLMWQMGGLGPMQGQSNHFKRTSSSPERQAQQSISRYAPEKIEYGINRYGNETRRLYRTMEDHLAKSPHGFLVGDRVTVADISCWGWVASHMAQDAAAAAWLRKGPPRAESAYRL
ncbi:Disulfide-bond oxidoreductase YfcG [Metarhizium anisopliae]